MLVSGKSGETAMTATRSENAVVGIHPPFVDNKGAIRAYWQDFENHEPELAEAIQNWVDGAKPGSRKARAHLMLIAGGLIYKASVDHIQDPEWFIKRMDKAIAEV
jgi:hypothetical protein